MSDAPRHTLPSGPAARAIQSAPLPAPFTPADASSGAAPIEPQTIVLRKDRPPYWAHDLPNEPRDLTYERYGDVVAQRLVTFWNEVHPSATFTATELQCFATCPNQYRWRYVHGARNGRLITPTLDELERTRVDASRGQIIHLYLQRHEDHWSEATMCDKLRDTIARSVDYPLASPEQYVEEFLPDVQRFLASPQYELMRSADEVLKEVSLQLRLHGQPGCVIEARPDVLIRRHGRWHIIDYKTARFHSAPNPLLALLDDTLRYEMQAALYLIALRECMGKHTVDSFTFFYTAHGVAVQETPTDVWLDGAEQLLSPMARWIQQGALGPTDPVWSASKCGGCDFRKTVCKPVGDPEGTPRPRRYV